VKGPAAPESQQMAYLPPPQLPPSDAGSQSSLREIWDTVRRHRWLVLGTAAATLVLVVAATLVMRPRYESVATLRIESNDPKSDMLSRLVPLEGLDLPGMGDEQIDTEIAVLRSRTLADEVAEQVGLHVHLASPRRARHEVLDVVRAPQDVPRGRFVLRRQGDGSYVAQQTKGQPVPLPERVRIGEPFSLGDVTLALALALRNDPPGSVRVDVRPFRRTVEKFRKDLRVKREGTSKLVGVTYRSSDPQLSAAVVNGITDTFIRYKLDTSHTESRSTVEVLREQIAGYRDELADAERQLQTFQEDQRVVAPREQADQQIRRVAHMQVRRDELRAERMSLAALVEQVRTRPAAEGAASPYRRLATFPSFIHNRAIQDILAHLTGAEAQRSLLLERRNEVDPDVQQLTARIRDLEQQMYQVATAYLTSLDNQLAATERVLDGFEGDLQRMPGNEVEYTRLAREQKLLSEVYLMLQTRLKEAEVQDAVDRGIVRVVDSAIVAEEPRFPKMSVNLLLGTVLGLMLGFIAAFGRDLMDTTVRTPADAEQASRGLLVLGAIPRISTGRSVLRNGGGRWISLPGRQVVPAAKAPVDHRLITRSDPRAAASEAYRALRTSITFAGQEKPLKLLVMTSALPGEGKSTNAANLAITLAQQGTRVLLVDADMRRGSLHGMLGGRRRPGLAHLLLGTTQLEEAVQTVETGSPGLSLYFLSCGDYPPNPAELLGSPRMRELTGELRARFDTVIFDAPPMNVVTDAAVLGPLADSTVLIARNGITNRSALEHAVTQLRNLRVPVGGVVLNDFTDPERTGYALTYGSAPPAD
jgi:polysaccharide biosynthesis transport protein